MSLTLYHSTLSPFAARVRILAAAKGIKLELAAPPGGLKSPDYLAINPLGKIPCLVVDDPTHGKFVLPESETICEYLEDRFPAPTLRPADPQARAKTRLISRYTDIYVFAPLGQIFGQLNPATRDQEKLDRNIAALSVALAHIEPLIEGPVYAVQNRLTLADCTFAPVAALIEIFAPILGAKTLLPDRLGRYLSAIEQDPHMAQALNDMRPALLERLKG